MNTINATTLITESCHSLAMTNDEMRTLQDVYCAISTDSKTQRTSYVLQTLWHDLTSEYDIIGPYYTSASTLKSKFLLPCVMDAIYQFHMFNFRDNTYHMWWSHAQSFDVNPLITNDACWRHPTLTQLPGEFPIEEAEAWRLLCGSRQNSRYGVPSPPWCLLHADTC